MPSNFLRADSMESHLTTYSPSESATSFADDSSDFMMPKKRSTQPAIDLTMEKGRPSTGRSLNRGRQHELRSGKDDRAHARDMSFHRKQPNQATAGATSFSSGRGRSMSVLNQRNESPGFENVDFDHRADDPHRHTSRSQKNSRGTKRKAEVLDNFSDGDEEVDERLKEAVRAIDFIPTDEPLFVGDDEGSSDVLSVAADEPDPLARAVKRNKASTLKKKLMQKPREAGKPGRRSKDVVHDPYNQLIKHLRQHEHYSWGAIVKEINRVAQQKGEVGSFTEAAAYSRFVRNAPRIAEFNGEHDFNPKNYMYLKYTAGGETEPETVENVEPSFTPQADEILVKAVAKIDEASERSRWTRVAQTLKMQGIDITAEQAMRRHARL